MIGVLAFDLINRVLTIVTRIIGTQGEDFMLAEVQSALIFRP